MATTVENLSKVITERGVDYIQKCMEDAYDHQIQMKVKQFEEELIRKRDEVVAGAVLHIMKMMDVDRYQDRVIITIRTKETPYPFNSLTHRGYDIGK